MPLEAVVFDFDGVLVDTEPLHLKASQCALADTGIALASHDYYERFLGFDDAGLFRALAAERGMHLDDPTLAELIEKKSQVLLSLLDSGSVLFPGAVECVHRCAEEVPLAIASGALGHEIDLILSRSGLRDAFRVIVGAEDTARSKPAPDPYVRAVELLRGGPGSATLASEHCVAIEDSRWGLESARAAGLRCVAVTHTYGPETLQGADLVARTLDEITVERLQQLCR
jgi:beta-phosphoglucomutase-like phosphatase (HAD superfamily)